MANTKTQRRYKVMTDASNLGELKAAFDAEGIDYAGMSFTEGITKSILLDDTTPLPETVMFKGEPKNPVILLTNTKKNIASGCGSRKEAYELIKEHNLADAIKDEFEINYTHISTADLWEFINNFLDDQDTEEEENDEELENEIYYNDDILSPIYDTIKALLLQDVLDTDDVEELSDMLHELAAREATPDAPEEFEATETTVSSKDIDDMINSLS